MTFLERNADLPQAITNSTILSSGQKGILNILIQFDAGISVSKIMELMNSSKQTIHFNLKKLMERDYILRKKEMVYIYRINQKKLLEILAREVQSQKATLLR